MWHLGGENTHTAKLITHARLTRGVVKLPILVTRHQATTATLRLLDQTTFKLWMFRTNFVSEPPSCETTTNDKDVDVGLDVSRHEFFAEPDTWIAHESEEATISWCLECVFREGCRAGQAACTTLHEAAATFFLWLFVHTRHEPAVIEKEASFGRAPDTFRCLFPGRDVAWTQAAEKAVWKRVELNETLIHLRDY